MSGPVAIEDVDPSSSAARPDAATTVVSPSREAQVGGLRVRRALPRRERRTVGAWCFVDHAGPARVSETVTYDVAPHPHMGLQTVTWLLAGEVVHRDSLGSEQVIRPGQLNLMTAGHGVAHSEEHTGAYRGDLHGVQLWVAQPSSTRHGAPAFEHHPELPKLALGPETTATVLVGELAGTASPARRDTDHLGTDLDLREVQPGFRCDRTSNTPSSCSPEQWSSTPMATRSSSPAIWPTSAPVATRCSCRHPRGAGRCCWVVFPSRNRS